MFSAYQFIVGLHCCIYLYIFISISLLSKNFGEHVWICLSLCATILLSILVCYYSDIARRIIPLWQLELYTLWVLNFCQNPSCHIISFKFIPTEDHNLQRNVVNLTLSLISDITCILFYISYTLSHFLRRWNISCCRYS